MDYSKGSGLQSLRAEALRLREVEDVGLGPHDSQYIGVI